MGFIADVMAVKNIQKIKNGGEAKLTVSQITGLLINLPDAHKNLSFKKSKEIYELYREKRNETQKVKMSSEDYFQKAIEIIKCFDVIAPYEKYCGCDDLEASFLLNEIRGNECRSITEEHVDEEVETYCNALVEASGMIDFTDAKQFAELLPIYAAYGKEEFMYAFDDFLDNIIKKYGAMKAVTIAPFFMGAVKGNGIINETELKNMKQYFTEQITKVIFENS